MAPSMHIDVKMEKKKKNKTKDLAEAEEVMDYVDDSSRKEKKKKKKKENDSALIQLIAKYLEKRNLHKSLSSLLSETQCESSWKTQTMDLEDIYNQYSNQDSENLKKCNLEDRNVEQENNHLSINDQNNNLKLLEQEVQREDANKLVNSNAAPSSKGELKISGALKSQVSGSDKSVSSCDNAQSELAKSKDKKRKASGKDVDPDLEKTPRQTDSVKTEKYLQESVEVPKEVKSKKKKKSAEYKDLIDNDEHKTSTCKENGNSNKDNNNPPKTSSKQTDCGKLDNTSQESLEVLKEEGKKKKKNNSEDKDLISNDEKKTSTNIENGNSIKEKSKPSKTSQKNKDSGKLDKSLQEALEVPKKEEKKKKKNFEDKDLTDNNEQKTNIDRENKKSVKDNSKPSKASNKLKDFMELDESFQESQEVPKQKRKKEQEAEDKDSGDDASQNGSKKNKKDNKECKKKLQSCSSNVTTTSEEATRSNLNDLAEDTDKSLFDITPRQKEVKEDEKEANVSLNSKQKSGEPTTAKAFQRVKVEEVQFVDPRLQDNSYWAKSGAEIGYGAKAEQVLGQVRGKDFRHEKTKKKRGSYKGGMIDLQSHSIKFSYSDEE